MDSSLIIAAHISVICGTAIFVVVLGGILGYHWRKFAMNNTFANIALVVYSVVSIALLLSLIAYVPL